MKGKTKSRILALIMSFAVVAGTLPVSAVPTVAAEAEEDVIISEEVLPAGEEEVLPAGEEVPEAEAEDMAESESLDETASSEEPVPEESGSKETAPEAATPEVAESEAEIPEMKMPEGEAPEADPEDILLPDPKTGMIESVDGAGEENADTDDDEGKTPTMIWLGGTGEEGYSDCYEVIFQTKNGYYLPAGVDYDAKTNTLSLKNYTIKGWYNPWDHRTYNSKSGGYGLYCDGDLNLVISGTCGNDSMEIPCGIFVNGDLTITNSILPGNDKLVLKPSGFYEADNISFGIACTGKLTINSRPLKNLYPDDPEVLSIEVSSPDSTYSSTGMSAGDALISGASMDIRAGNSTHHPVQRAGTYVMETGTSQGMAVSGSLVLSGTQGFQALGNDSEYSSYGIRLDGNLTINEGNGNILFRSGNAADTSVGLMVAGDEARIRSSVHAWSGKVNGSGERVVSYGAWFNANFMKVLDINIPDENGVFDLSSGTVTGADDKEAASAGLYVRSSDKCIILRSGKLIAKGGDAKGGKADSYGVHICAEHYYGKDNVMWVGGAGSVEATAGKAVSRVADYSPMSVGFCVETDTRDCYANGVTFASGSSLRAKSGEKAGTGRDDVVTDSGTGLSAGLYANCKVMLSENCRMEGLDFALLTQRAKKDGYYGPELGVSIVLNNGAAWNDNASKPALVKPAKLGKTPMSSERGEDILTVYLGSDVAKSVNTKVYEPEEYDLWIAGTRVTRQNQSTISGYFNSGSISYDPATHTLTLNGVSEFKPTAFSADAYQNCQALIYATGDLTVKTINDSEISIVDNWDYGRPAILVENGDLTFTGSADLNIVTHTGLSNPPPALMNTPVWLKDSGHRLEVNMDEGKTLSLTSDRKDHAIILGSDDSSSDTAFVLKSGNLSAVANGQGVVGLKMYGTGLISFEGGSATLQGNGTGNVSALMAGIGSEIRFADTLAVTNIIGAHVMTVNGRSITIAGANDRYEKTVVVGNKEDKSYGIWIGNTQVKESNRDYIPVADGSVSYDPETKVLFFDNVKKIGSYNYSDGTNAFIHIEGEDVKIQGSLDLNKNRETDSPDDTAGIKADRSSVELEGDFSFVLDDGFGIRMNGSAPKALVISGADTRLNIDIQTDNTRPSVGRSPIACVNLPFIMNDGNVTLKGGGYYGIDVDGADLTVNGGTLDVTCGKLANGKSAVRVSFGKDIHLNNKTKVVDPAGGGVAAMGSDGSGLGLDGNVSRHVKVAEGVQHYGVWVGNTEVTDENQNNILPGLEDIAFSFDPAKRILYLNGPLNAAKDLSFTHNYVDDGLEALIYAKGDLTIVVNGYLSLDQNIETEPYNFAGIFATGNLTIIKESETDVGALVLQRPFGAEAKAYSYYGVVCGGNLTVKDVQALTVCALPAKEESYGIYAMGDAVFDAREVVIYPSSVPEGYSIGVMTGGDLHQKSGGLSVCKFDGGISEVSLGLLVGKTCRTDGGKTRIEAGNASSTSYGIFAKKYVVGDKNADVSVTSGEITSQEGKGDSIGVVATGGEIRVGGPLSVVSEDKDGYALYAWDDGSGSADCGIFTVNTQIIVPADGRVSRTTVGSDNFWTVFNTSGTINRAAQFDLTDGNKAEVSLEGWTYGEAAKEPVFDVPEGAELIPARYKGRLTKDGSEYTDTGTVPSLPGEYHLTIGYKKDGSNYWAETDFRIAPKKLGLDITLLDRAYRKNDRSISYNAVLTGVENDDEVSLDDSNAKVLAATENVGDDIAVYLSGFAVTGKDAGNYLSEPLLPKGMTVNIFAADIGERAGLLKSVFARDGSEKKPKVVELGTGTVLEQGEDYTVEGGAVSAAETGTYYISIAGANNYTGTTVLPWKISEPPVLTKKPLAVQNLKYTGSLHKLVEAGAMEAGTLSYVVSDDSDNAPAKGWDIQIPEAADAGTYYVWFKGTSSEGLETGVEYTAVTIAKGIIQLSGAPAEGTVLKLPYTGEEQELLSSGIKASGEGCSLKYSLDGNTWSDQVPGKKEMGEYSLYYKVEGGKNYEDIAPVKITVVIGLGEADREFSLEGLSDGTEPLKLVVMSPRKSVSYNGKKHVSAETKLTAKQEKTMSADLNCAVLGLSETLTLTYVYKNNVNASAEKPYFYLKLKANKKSEKYKNLDRKAKSAFNKAVKKANKQLATETGRMHFTIDARDLGGFSYDASLSGEKALLFTDSEKNTITVNLKRTKKGKVSVKNVKCGYGKKTVTEKKTQIDRKLEQAADQSFVLTLDGMNKNYKGRLEYKGK
ncbi:MAG: hypothetical protein IKR68_10125 [Lachnospiraceae bacterium]|nr:hypothetical protein [Lachnospiraceae bacterium]